MFFRKKPKETMTARYAAAVAFVVMVGINIAANVLPINNQTTGQISDAYPNLFAPAGVTFSIWGLIYLLLGFYTLYQLRWLKVKKPQVRVETLERITPLYIVSSLLNTGWILAWHYDYIGLSVFLIVGMLASLAYIHRILSKEKMTSREQWLVKAPFSVYFGWITIATIANIITWLVSVQWDGWGIAPDVWMSTMLIVGALIGLLVMKRSMDYLYGLVFVWAYGGILLKHVSMSGFAGKYPEVIFTLVLSMMLFIGYSTYLYRDQLGKK